MITRILLLFLSPFLISSCTNTPGLTIPEVLQAHYPIDFGISSVDIQKSIRFQATLRANKTGDTLILYGCIKNGTGKLVKISPYLLQLQTQEHHRTFPTAKNTEISLRSHKSSSFSYRFTPTNNRLLYARTGFRGDLDSTYSVKMDFLRDIKGEKLTDQAISFRANRKAYRDYKNLNAMDDSFTLYQLNKHTISRENPQNANVKSSINGNSEYTKVTSPEGLQLTETEILSDGIIANTKFYFVKDSLFLNLRIVNHGNQAIHFNPNALKVLLSKSSGIEEMHPCFRKDVARNGGEITLAKGDRFQTLLNFGNFEHQPDEFQFDLSTVQYSSLQKMIFPILPTYKSVK